jgi:hypothetical protein
MPSILLARRRSPLSTNLGSTLTISTTLYSIARPINLCMKSTFAFAIYPGTLDPTNGTNLLRPNPPAKSVDVYNRELNPDVWSAQKLKNLNPLVSTSTIWCGSAKSIVSCFMPEEK